MKNLLLFRLFLTELQKSSFLWSRVPTMSFFSRIWNISKYRRRIVIPDLWLWRDFFSYNTIFLLKFPWTEKAGSSREAQGSTMQRHLFTHSHSTHRFFSSLSSHWKCIFKRFVFIFNYVYACAFLCGYLHEYTCLQKPEECIRCLVLGVISGCELPEVGTGAEFRFCTKSMCESHLGSPEKKFALFKCLFLWYHS